MKRIILFIALGIPVLVFGQSFQLNWSVFSGGGGTSTGGVFALSGSIGQHDAGAPMAGSGFSLTGGFWSLYAIPTAGAPRLEISRTSTNTALISWPSLSAGFVLQQNSNLGSTNWVNV